jgi:hypothetical protein
MESCLGSVEFSPSSKKDEFTHGSSQSAIADRAAEETEDTSKSGRGIAKMYWEGVESGKARNSNSYSFVQPFLIQNQPDRSL